MNEKIHSMLIQERYPKVVAMLVISVIINIAFTLEMII